MHLICLKLQTFEMQTLKITLHIPLHCPPLLCLQNCACRSNLKLRTRKNPRLIRCCLFINMSVADLVMSFVGSLLVKGCSKTTLSPTYLYRFWDPLANVKVSQDNRDFSIVVVAIVIRGFHEYTILPLLPTLYPHIFAHYVNHMMLVNMKIDVSEKRITC